MQQKPFSQAEPSFVEFSAADVDQTIGQRFERQAHRFPERVAIKTPQRAISYDELNRSANRIARAIIDSVGSGLAPVALYFRGGAQLIAAGLGALKAGKPYAPLDVQLPKSKAQRILASLESSLVLSDEKSLAAARQLAGKSKKVLNIDELDGSRATEDLGLSLAPDSIAYINFTSGSTGAPKGVAWNHRSELFGIRAKTNALRITAADRISLLRANNVGAVRDMHLALLNGAAVVTVDLQQGGLVALARWLKDEAITVFSCVATIFRQAVESAAGAEDFATIRLVHIGGESVFKADVELYKKYFSDGCRFVNRYSISETQAVSYFFIDKRTDIVGERVPAGYALDGSEIRILDDDGKELGPGDVGEIAIRSPYLAIGYWRRPELTGAKFVADPENPAVRTYRSGDLGYLLRDGCLMHVGRKDFQAKIRGHRVEPEAIEAALHEIGSVKQAAVVSADHPGGSTRLIAYIVPRSAASKVKALRAQLKTRLPSYMVPAAFVFIERLPLTAGGKVDRRALPAMPARGRAVNPTAVAPRSSLERLLIKIWRDVLAVEAVGVHDDFAELGGDSLLGARIVARVGESFPFAAPLANLFQTSTVAGLAAWLVAHEPQSGQAEKIAAILVEIESMSDQAILDAVDKIDGQGRDG